MEDVYRRRLRELGAQSELRYSLNATLPWVISIGLHLLGVVIALLVTWAVVAIRATPDTALIVADFRQPTLAPVVPMTPAMADGSAGGDAALELTIDLPPPPTSPRAGSAALPAPPSPEMAPMLPEFVGESVNFAGIRAGNARKIVYVVDASGSMVGTLPIILEELTRSLRALSPSQSFAIVFFQRNQAVFVPPANRLVPALPDERERAIRWFRARITGAGRSNPLRALEAALRLRPDVIFLLGHEVTGSGEFEISQSDLLAALDRLNPVHRATGRRPVVINCVQFLDPDPLHTLRRIAEEHGGPDGYRYLDRAELGVAPR